MSSVDRLVDGEVHGFAASDAFVVAVDPDQGPTIADLRRSFRALRTLERGESAAQLSLGFLPPAATSSLFVEDNAPLTLGGDQLLLNLSAAADQAEEAPLTVGELARYQFVLDLSTPVELGNPDGKINRRLRAGINIRLPSGQTMTFSHFVERTDGHHGRRLVAAFERALGEALQGMEFARAKGNKKPRGVHHVPQLFPWAGHKRDWVDLLGKYLPSRIEGTLHIPFFGSGSVFFGAFLGQGRLLAGNPIILSDTNGPLMRLFWVLQDSEALEAMLFEGQKERYSNEERAYYAIREAFNARLMARGAEMYSRLFGTPMDHVVEAAEFLYILKTAWGGLHRVRKDSGTLNVPFGWKGYRTVTVDGVKVHVQQRAQTIFDHNGLWETHRALQGVTLLVGDFRAVLAAARQGDFVYLDPPYIPASPTASFTSYSVDGFGILEQWWLAQTMKALDSRGVYWLLSNADVSWARDLYAGFNIHGIDVVRKIAGHTIAREVLAANYRVLLDGSLEPWSPHFDQDHPSLPKKKRDGQQGSRKSRVRVNANQGELKFAVVDPWQLQSAGEHVLVAGASQLIATDHPVVAAVEHMETEAGMAPILHSPGAADQSDFHLAISHPPLLPATGRGLLHKVSH